MSYKDELKEWFDDLEDGHLRRLANGADFQSLAGLIRKDVEAKILESFRNGLRIGQTRKVKPKGE